MDGGFTQPNPILFFFPFFSFLYKYQETSGLAETFFKQLCVRLSSALGTYTLLGEFGKMVKLLSLKGLGSIALVVLPLLFLIWQNVGGIFALRDNTYDKTIFSVIMALLMSGGFALQAKGGAKQFKWFVISAGFMIGIPLLVSGLVATNDLIQGTELGGGLGFYFALDTIGGQVTEWTALIKVIVAIIPAIVIVIGIVGIYLADTFDEMQVPIIETIVAVVVMALANFLFSWMGTPVF